MHFLHIPKTGGTAIKHALAGYGEGEGRVVEFHGHARRLADLEAGTPVGFVLRDPVSRFASAFYSRRREGRPRYRSAWSDLERQVFGSFETPGELAEALGDPALAGYELARRAMDGIGHFRSLGYWLGSLDVLRRRDDDLIFVGFQESLTEDFERLKHALGLPAEIALPEDEVLAHRNPADVDLAMSAAAELALRSWYRADYELIEGIRGRPRLADGRGLRMETGMTNQRTTGTVVAVLGSGRSGTSLLMQVLQALGMPLGEASLLPGSGANPDGFFEDEEVVAIHKVLIEQLNAHPAGTLPAGWLDTPAAGKARTQLRRIVDARLKQFGGQWAFKDPRTSTFMPLWVKLFNQPGLQPRYVLAVRDPASVLASLRDYGARDDVIGELLWLRRNVEALHHTAGNCFIVHYEDWFERPEELARGLLTYTGLEDGFQGDVGEVVQRVVKARLNRAPRKYRDVAVRNPLVSELYEALRNCSGADFDHAALMDRVERVRRTMSGFDAGTSFQMERERTRARQSAKIDVPAEAIDAVDERPQSEAGLVSANVPDTNAEKRRVMADKSMTREGADHDTKHKQELVEMSAAHKRALSDAEASHRQELNERDTKHKQELAEAIAAHKRELSLVDASHGEEMTALVHENARLLRELVAAEKSVESMRTALKGGGQGGGAPAGKAASAPSKKTALKPSPEPTIRPVGHQRLIARLERDLAAARRSYSFRIGQVVVNAVAKPGLNTLAAPFRLVGLLVELLRSRFSRK